MREQLWWYVARASGVTAWALAMASVLWGLALSTRALGRRLTGPWLLDLHRFLGGLSVVFVGVHLLGLWADSFVHFGPAELFVPLASTWRPGAVAWGVVAFYLLVAVEITSLLRGRIPEPAWRAVHYLSVGIVVTGTVHGVQAGTDVDNPLIWWPSVLALVAACALLAVRLVGVRDDRDAGRDRAEVLARAAAGLRDLADAPPPPRPDPAVDADRHRNPTSARSAERSAAPAAPDELAAAPLPRRTPLRTLVQAPPPTLDDHRRTRPPPTEPIDLRSGPPQPPRRGPAGKPDQAAYRAWLVDWLAYVDAYGEQEPTSRR